MTSSKTFTKSQIEVINDAVALAEELVSNHFKMSANQWLRPKYDVRTLAQLSPDETVEGPFAQIIRYEGKPQETALGSKAYDFYKICLQDHAILKTLEECPEIALFPFILYISTHELIHIVRFSKFLQSFDASNEEKMAEEKRVHTLTHEILNRIRVDGMEPVFRFYEKWLTPLEGFEDPAGNKDKGAGLRT